MAKFQITPDPYHKERSSISSAADHFTLSVFAGVKGNRPLPPVNKYTYIVIFGTGRRAVSLGFVLGNTDLPMSKALWDKQLFLSAIDFYKEENDLPDLSLVKNAATGNIIFQAEDLYADSFEREDSYE
ncbi:hypothetical protein [Mucilaginibacter aquariorum]|uniref:Uncharacterized protein n=1 Tax=Mucilaginibacter aquariorum TaxID=2967225 RepID=A0ABT1SXH4_9SPHI|nr:hypothetical protein [Mucilaginibacter aquariorum]MCQ6957063.1 hypothetical protein [Mucilaginibacter aquariorum]